MTILMAIYWGIFGDAHKFIAVASIMAWGPGDATAAIIGKNFGSHKLSGKWIEGVKSMEGSVAMAVTSFIFTFLTLITMSHLPIGYALIVSLIIAPIASLVELYTKHGLDTITVPIVSSIILLITMFIYHM